MVGDKTMQTEGRLNQAAGAAQQLYAARPALPTDVRASQPPLATTPAKARCVSARNARRNWRKSLEPLRGADFAPSFSQEIEHR